MPAPPIGSLNRPYLLLRRNAGANSTPATFASLQATKHVLSLSKGMEAAEKCFTGLTFPELWMKIAPPARGRPLPADSGAFPC